MSLVAAVIVNRNTRELLKECLCSFADQDFNGGISIWVVDNASTDGSQGVVLREFPRANLLWNTRNTGYAAACNRGIGLSTEPYLLVLNSDTVLSRDTVSCVVDFFENNPGAGVLGPRILNPDGTIQYSCREFPDLKEAFMHAFVGLFRADNPYSVRYKKADWGHDEEREVDWVSGAFMALRREAFERVGGFDERYYMYVEDVDICWRMWKAGWTVNYIPRGDVVHHIGRSSIHRSTVMTLHHHRSMLHFHLKTYRGPCRIPVNALVIAGVAARFAFIAGLNLYYRVREALGGPGRLIMPGRQ